MGKMKEKKGAPPAAEPQAVRFSLPLPVPPLMLARMMPAMPMPVPVELPEPKPVTVGGGDDMVPVPEVANVWWARTHDRCCPHGGRDGLIVVLGSEETVREVLRHAENPNGEFVQVRLVNEHLGTVASAMLDPEALEQHVNNCTAAVATLRQRRAFRGDSDG